jgi:hypothetical protein
MPMELRVVTEIRPCAVSRESPTALLLSHARPTTSWPHAPTLNQAQHGALSVAFQGSTAGSARGSVSSSPDGSPQSSTSESSRGSA